MAENEEPLLYLVVDTGAEDIGLSGRKRGKSLVKWEDEMKQN
jgi:hypothetical protein